MCSKHENVPKIHFTLPVLLLKTGICKGRGKCFFFLFFNKRYDTNMVQVCFLNKTKKDSHSKMKTGCYSSVIFIRGELSLINI